MQLLENRKAMFDQLAPVAIGIVIFAVILITGIVITQNLTKAVGCDGVLGLNSETTTFNVTDGRCHNTTAAAYTTAATWSPNTPGATGWYLQGKLGEGSGGLAGWTPAIIALIIGVMFIGAFAGGFGRKKQY